MLRNIQALRAFAAIGVVVFHFGLVPATMLPFKVGASGVDLFFVLSGFIIAHSSERSARHFLVHRVMRVVPGYWIATLIAALFTLQSLDLGAAVDWLIQSLFYLPSPGGRPVLIFVAWTLIYELAFYLLYWMALRFGPHRAPIIAIATLLILALIRLPGSPGPWPLLLEFGMGISIYLLTERHARLRSISGPGGLLVASVGLALLLTLPRVTGYSPDDYQAIGRVLCWGMPAAIIILGLVIAERSALAIKSKAVALVGAASYAIYLLHPIALGQLLQLPPNSALISWAVCLAAVGVTVALSIAFHLAIEAPLLRRMRTLLGDRLPVAQRAST